MGDGLMRAELDGVADDINVLAAYLGPRDVPELTRENLRVRCGMEQADVFVLFGGSILEGGNVLAEAIRAKVARTYAIVGGAGHTTEALRQKARMLVPDIPVADGATEAEIFSACIAREGLEADLLEMHSTNCGNNITFLKALLEERRIAADSLILAQDATMERRMVAGLGKEMPHARAIAYATYAVRVEAGEEGLRVKSLPLGMWDMERYLTLLMGEIPRLEDGPEGYGPRGRGYIAHVDIPDEVLAAWQRLAVRYPWSVRRAQSRFAAPLGE